MRITSRLVAVAALALVACGESDTDPVRPPPPGMTVPQPLVTADLRFASGGRRDSLPPDTSWVAASTDDDGAEAAPLIIETGLTAYIGSYGFGGLAEASAWMRYYATWGSITTTVKAIQGNTLLNSATQERSEGTAFAWFSRLSDITQVTFSGTCGVRNESRAAFLVEMRLPFQSTQPSSDSRGGFDTAYLPDCIPQSTGGGSKTGVLQDSGWMICWYMIFYDHQGDVTDIQELFCEPI